MRKALALGLLGGLGTVALWSGCLAPATKAAAFETPSARPTDSTTVTRRIWYQAPNYPRLTLPDGARREIRSLLNVPHPLSFGDYVWDETGVPPGPIWIRVDVGAQLISVFRGEDEIGTAVILYGAPAKPTPVGVFRVMQKAQAYWSKTYDAPMPYMLRLTQDGVAIHASSVRAGWATHGCIGVPLAFARRLFSEARLGDTVMVVRTDGPAVR